MPGPPLQVEPQETQLRRARARRSGLRFGVSVSGAVTVSLVVFNVIEGRWTWWLVPLSVIVFGVGVLISLGEAVAAERLTRWFTRPPR